MRDQRLTEEDYGGYDFDFLGNQLITGDSLLSVIWTSPLLAAVSRTQASVSSMRYLHEVRLCSLSIQVQDWVLLRYGCAVVRCPVSIPRPLGYSRPALPTTLPRVASTIAQSSNNRDPRSQEICCDCSDLTDGAAVVCHGERVEAYLWCCHCHVASKMLEDPDGLMRIDVAQGKGALEQKNALIALSQVSISALVCEHRSDHLEFRYVF